MMRELRWYERAPESQLVRVWLYGTRPFYCLADSLYLFNDCGIQCVEIA